MSPVDAERQRRSRVLADPTRFRVWQAITRSAQPLGVAALAQQLGLHPNTVRLHLDRLVEVGLVHDEREAEHRPGRPARVYRTAAPDPATEADAYRRLAQVLAMAVRQQISAREAGRIAGAAEAPATHAADPVDAVVAAMAATGFSPASAGSAGDEVDIALHSCPLASVAREDPATICQLHHGLIEGFADATGDVQVAALHPATAPGTCCHVVLRRQR